MARERRPGRAERFRGQFTCPECDRTFALAQALGAHRRRAHGVPGTSRRPRTPPDGGAGVTVDRDALLRTVFPNGVPARSDVIRALAAWLDEAERLAGM